MGIRILISAISGSSAPNQLQTTLPPAAAADPPDAQVNFALKKYTFEKKRRKTYTFEKYTFK